MKKTGGVVTSPFQVVCSDDEQIPGWGPKAIAYWMQRDMNLSAIARMYGKTPQAASYLRRVYIESSPRKKVMETFPWKPVSDVHSKERTPHMLRLHGYVFAEGVASISDQDLVKLNQFYRRLEDNGWVVDYDPDRGFIYRTRTESDNGLIVRQSDRTDMDEEALRIWELPQQLPLVKD